MKGYAMDRFKKNPGAKGMMNVYALSFRFRKRDEDSSIKMNYAGSGYEGIDPGIGDYMRHDFKVGYQWRMGSDWRVKTVGQIGFNQVAEKYQIVPELEYRWNDDSSVRFYAGHATKMFAWQDRTDQKRFVGLTYETQLADQTLEFGYRYNVNDSQVGYYDYINSKYTVGYRVPWSEKGRTLFQLEYSPRQYMSQYVSTDLENDPEFRALRQDEGLTFSAVSRIPLSPHFELVPRYSFKVKSFNDPWMDDYVRHLSSFALRGRW
jgi:hypothetical protein